MSRKQVKIPCRQYAWKWDTQGGRSVEFSVPDDRTNETFYIAFTNPVNKVPIKQLRVSRDAMHCLVRLYLEEMTGIKASDIGEITVARKPEPIPGEPS